MSLRAFHIVFVTICTLLCVFLVVWGFLLAPDTYDSAMIMGGTGIAGLLLVPIYGIYFLRKSAKLQL